MAHKNTAGSTDPVRLPAENSGTLRMMASVFSFLLGTIAPVTLMGWLLMVH